MFTWFRKFKKKIYFALVQDSYQEGWDYAETIASKCPRYLAVQTLLKIADRHTDNNYRIGIIDYIDKNLRK